MLTRLATLLVALAWVALIGAGAAVAAPTDTPTPKPGEECTGWQKAGSTNLEWKCRTISELPPVGGVATGNTGNSTDIAPTAAGNPAPGFFTPRRTLWISMVLLGMVALAAVVRWRTRERELAGTGGGEPDGRHRWKTPSWLGNWFSEYY
ncbi:hypothetical protein D5S17_04730 [Pseudonocardiaceae bacterium YIM PH 21723]|nr:hypothetical protein D5S17_04730 [Pseudonocardiaceae bacterium YIM PH 21723]